MGVGDQPHAPASSSAGKDPAPTVQEAGWAPGPVWKGGKSRPHRYSILDRPARSSVAIPTELQGPHNIIQFSGLRRISLTRLPNYTPYSFYSSHPSYMHGQKQTSFFTTLHKNGFRTWITNTMCLVTFTPSTYFLPSCYTFILNEVPSKVRQQSSLDTVLQHPILNPQPALLFKKNKL